MHTLPTPDPDPITQARRELHALVEALPAELLGPTLALLEAGPRCLVGRTRTTPPPRRPGGPPEPGS